jgi:hypothetical protein
VLVARAAVLGDARELVLAGDQDVGNDLSSRSSTL